VAETANSPNTDLELAARISTQLGRKFEAGDVTHELAAAAQRYLDGYTGNFSFLTSLLANGAQRRYGLTTGQAKGVLNCMVADYRKQQETTPTFASIPVVPDGKYTVVFNTPRNPDNPTADEDADDYVTLRLKTPIQGNFKGRQIAAYLSGPDNNSNYTGFATVDGSAAHVWQRFTASPTFHRPIAALSVLLNMDPDTQQLAGLAYALRSGNCYRCGRTLTVPASLYRGMGPICAQGKGGHD